MRIQPLSNQKQHDNTKFKAIYAADPWHVSDLSALIKLTNTKRGKSCRGIILSYIGPDLLKQYDSLLFNKGITATYHNKPVGDIFLTKKEEKLIRNYNKKIINANQEHNSEDAINQRLLLFEELKTIIEKAKPISTRKILSNTERLKLEVRQANTKATKNIFNN